MARGEVTIKVVPVLSATKIAGVAKDVSISQDPTLLSLYINQNRPASHDVIEVDFRGPRPIVIYREHA